jgi:rhodanese-related sulfurtransferase
MQRLAASAVKAYLDADPGIVLLDVREHWELDRARVDGAVHIPMGTIDAARARLDRDAFIVVMCHHGARSAQVAMFLERCGYARVANLEGGIDAWSTDVDPEVPRY